MTRDGGSRPSKGHDKGTGRLRQGQLLANRYYVLAEIGRGGMGSIYRVKDNTLKEEVALKTLLPQFLQDKHVVERFFNEARIARTLSHPNIVRVHDIGASQGSVYISMELLQGKSLRQMLEDLMPGDRLPMRQVLDIFDQLCAALEYAHRYTVHRDLKPENVMVMNDGTVKLMDFGISKLMGDASLTSASMVMGTPHYMSPEQVKHSAGVDQRADIYSLGVMLYETLTGSLPTAIHKPVSKIARGIPPTLDPIIETCLQDDPARRYASASELRAALAQVRGQLGFTEADALPSHRRVRSAPGWFPSPKRAVGVVLLALLLAGTAVGLWRAETTRAHVIEEFNSTPAPAPATPEEGTSESTHNLTPLSLETAMPFLGRAKARAGAAVRRLAEGEVRAYRESLFEEAVDWQSQAEASQGVDEAVAFEGALQALHRYLALIDWPQNSVFIPPAGASPGFFIQDRPVTAAEFEAFSSRGEGWRWPETDRSLEDDDPMVFVTWYDAQGFLAAQEVLNVLPDAVQWERAFEMTVSIGALRVLGEPTPAAEENSEVESMMELVLGDDDEAEPGWVPKLSVAKGLLEWTDTLANGEDRAPGFGDLLAVRGIELGPGPSRLVRDTRAFERASADVGFRGAHTLPMTVERVSAAL